MKTPVVSALGRLALVVLIATSCTYGQRLASLEGKDPAAVRASLGEPTEIERHGDNDAVFIYAKRRLHWGEELKCTSFIYFNGGRVVDHRYQGNGCGRNLDRPDTTYADKVAANKAVLQGFAASQRGSGYGASAGSSNLDTSNGRGPAPAVCNCIGYNGPGGPCYDGPGGAAYSGPGGPAYAGPGGPCYDGPGGAAFSGPGGPMYDGPGGPMYDGPGGPCYDGPGGAVYAGPGGPCYGGPGGPCYSGPGGGNECPYMCQACGS